MAGGSAFKKPRSLSRSPMAPNTVATQDARNAGMQRLMGSINSLTARSQAANPPSLGGYSNPLAGPGGTNSNYMTPQDRSAFGALQAGASNNAQYGNFGPTPGMQYSQGLPQTQAGMADRIANQNPMYAGMQRQFGAQSPLGQQASQYGADQARADAGQGVFLQPGGYGSNQQFSPFDQAAGRAFMQNRLAGTTRSAMLNSKGPDNFAMTQAEGGIAGTNRLGALRAAVASNPRDEDLQGALRAEDSRQQGLRAKAAAKHQQFLADNNGMSANQLRRQREVGKKGQARYNRAVMAGLNPMSSKAQALFPDQTKAFMEQKNGKMPVANPMAPASNTPAGRQQAAGTVAQLAASDPNIQALGVDPSLGTVGLHQSLSNRMAEDPTGAFDDGTLQSYQKFAASSFAADPGMADPSKYTSFPGDVFTQTEGKVNAELWKELADLPDNPRARQQWLEKYKNRQQKIDQLTEQNYGAYGS
jgi:hypothetical protein